MHHKLKSACGPKVISRRSPCHLVTLVDVVEKLKCMEEKLMATLQEVKDAIAAEKAEVLAGVGALNDQIQALKDQIANGDPVTPEDLDALVSSVHDIFTA